MTLMRLKSTLGKPIRIPSEKRFSARHKARLAALFALLSAAVAFAADSADPKRYLTDVKDLSAPIMEGRGAGTQGLARASQYIEHRYKTLGLLPAGVEGYRQPFTVTTGAVLKADNSLSVVEQEKKKLLMIGHAFEPISFSSSGTFSGPLRILAESSIGWALM